MSELLLKATGISKSFGPTQALKDVSFSLHRGDICGLIGENGSGKSTLCSILTGLYKADAGEMEMGGETYAPANMIDAQRKGVAMIVQEMGTISGIGIADNIFVGKEKRFVKGGLVRRKALVKAAEEALEDVVLWARDPEKNVKAQESDKEGQDAQGGAVVVMECKTGNIPGRDAEILHLLFCILHFFRPFPFCLGKAKIVGGQGIAVSGFSGGLLLLCQKGNTDGTLVHPMLRRKNQTRYLF